MRTLSSVLFAAIMLATNIVAQETIDVTFKYFPNNNAQRVFVPGEFNNWGNNSSGQINVNDGSLMTEDLVNGFWYKSISLTIGGGTATNNGQAGYAYKFHEQYNGSGTEWAWFTDPLNDIAIGANSDSYVQVTHPMIFQIQESYGLIEDDIEFWITVAAKDTDPINITNSEFYLNGELAGTFEDNYEEARQLFFLKDITNYDLITGSNSLKIVAVTDLGESISDSLQFTYAGDSSELDKERPAGLADGITYGEDGTSATLSLFAPFKRNAFLIGDFSDWLVDLDYQMYRDSVDTDSAWFWIEVEGLTPGIQYGFQYLVDGTVSIADPYAPLLLHQSEDNSIPASVFPNLKAYPLGQTTGYVGLLEPGKAEFVWEATDYVRPDKESLVIYELLIRDFLADHSFNSLVDSLDYLERLGINAIELMPVNEYDGNESWGYNPASHIALDKYYGTPEAFKRFVDEAHKRGIAVIIDVVLNHATERHSLYRLYDFGSNPYFNTTPKHEFNVFSDFNHQYSGTQYYTKRMIEHWISEYNVDGFRWDLTKGFTQQCTTAENGCTSSYQQDRVDLLKKYADYQWAIDPDFIVIFEHLGTDEEESEWANYRIDEGKGIMLWGKMNGAYNEATMGYNEGGKSNLFGVLSESRSFEKRHLVGYMESHDEQWLMFKNRSFGNSSGEFDVRELDIALSRQKLAGAFFFTLPGPKMMWQFGEVGYGYGNNGEECLKPGGDSDGDCAPSVADRVGNKPIRWDYWNNPSTEERIKLYKTWAALINLRKSSPAFTDPESALYNLSNVIKRITLEHEDSDVVIVGNFDVNSRNPNVDFTSTGTWYDFFDGAEIEVTDVEQTVALGPGEFKIYTTKQFEAPEMGISVSNELDNNLETPTSFKLYTNYPNPFNPSTNIQFDISNAGDVTLEVFDVLGRKVADLVQGYKTAGTYTVSFDASRLSSGLYFSKLSSGGSVQIQKMTLLK